MKKYDSLILCEGETDQALIGSYLEATSGWSFVKSRQVLKGLPFEGENIVSYQKNEDTLGIWKIGGNDFRPAMTTIIEGEKMEKLVEKIIIVTDHDDADAEENRLQAILSTISNKLGIEDLNHIKFQNSWNTIPFQYAFGKTSIQFCYLLVPLTGVGALETFMMDSLSEKNDEQYSVIKQAKEFVANFQSQVYLKERREKVKAELGVSLSVFCPDKVFTTMKELIESVHWDKFSIAHTQFERLKEL